MARLPGWIAQTGNRTATEYTVTMRLRPWHPSFLPVIWRTVDVRPRVLKPPIVLWLWVKMARRGAELREVA